MTRIYRSSLNTNAPITNDMKLGPEGEHLEHTRKDLQQHEAGKSVGAPQQNGTTDGSLKDTKALDPSSRRTLLAHVFWAIFAWLLVMSAVRGFKLSPFATSNPCPSPVKEDHGATTFPTTLSPDTDISSSLPSSHTTPAAMKILELCTPSPQNMSLISMVSSACSCLNRLSTDDGGTVTVTSTTTVSAKIFSATISPGKVYTDSTRTVVEYYHDERLCAASNSDKSSRTQAA